MAKIVRRTVDEDIDRIEAFIASMERKYKMSSDAMAKAAWKDHSLDTPEVATWLIKHRTLKDLRQVKAQAESGTTTGTPTTIT